MIGFSRLLCGETSNGDKLRYERPLFSNKKPIVVWNCTNRCNLKCLHCYYGASIEHSRNELSTEDGIRLIDNLKEFNIPVLLFSGGEPLLREDIFNLSSYAVNKGLRVALSTSGTLIDEKTAIKIKDAGFSYVGISVDGAEEINDEFRCVKGSFQKSLEGIRNCRKLGIKVGIRFTITKRNYLDLNSIFDLIEKEDIPRACFYHLVYTGRAKSLIKEAITNNEAKSAVDIIYNKAKYFYKAGKKIEILTVDNYTDAVYLFLKLKMENPQRAIEALKLLKNNGGNSSGIGIASVDHQGYVHPDQFWQHYSLGNIKEKHFSDIWENPDEPLLKLLRNRKGLLTGKCSKCPYLDICNGNLRVRAEAINNDLWAEDPGCYLSRKELENGVFENNE